MIDIGLLHLVEELACIRGQRLDIAALSLGKNGVEGQAALARTRETRDDDQLITRDSDIYVFQVMFASTANYNFVLRHATEPPIHIRLIWHPTRGARYGNFFFTSLLIQTFDIH